MRCCDCEFRKECRDEQTILTCFVKCNIRDKKLKQKAEQDCITEKGGKKENKYFDIAY